MSKIIRFKALTSGKSRVTIIEDGVSQSFILERGGSRPDTIVSNDTTGNITLKAKNLQGGVSATAFVEAQIDKAGCDPVLVTSGLPTLLDEIATNYL